MEICCIEDRFEALERRLGVLEELAERPGSAGPEETGALNRALELDLTLPEADIDGLRFNETKVHAVFEKKEDGWYHSRDILFLSARNLKDDNSRDILTEYLKLGTVNNAFYQALKKAGIVSGEDAEVEIVLPEENGGIKKYNGVNWWYWLEGCIASSVASFCTATYDGFAATGSASSMGGCAPAFRVMQQRRAE